MSKPIHLLFMCVANSARSQLAEGLAKYVFASEAVVQSAGSRPGKLNPFAVEVMNELGLDISEHYSKSVSDLNPAFLAKVDYIITLCADEVCPYLPGVQAERLHWPFPDPATHEKLSREEMLARFRKARDGILAALQKFKVNKFL